ncbi:hypothetical protein GQ457_09G029410 [Hibiscus cannabinus]
MLCRGECQAEEEEKDLISPTPVAAFNVRCSLFICSGKWNFMSKRYGMFYGGYMFPLLFKEELDFWPEQNLRQRTWMNVKEAGDVCQH